MLRLRGWCLVAAITLARSAFATTADEPRKPADAPVDAAAQAAAQPTPAPAEAPHADAPVSAESAVLPGPVSLGNSRLRPVHWSIQGGAGVAGGLLSVPVAIYLGQWFGSLSNSIIGAAIPTFLCLGLIPPLITTLAAWAVGNWHEWGTYRFWPAAGAAFVVNALALVVAGFAGVNTLSVGSVLLFALVDGLFMSGAATATMRLWPLKQPPNASTVSMRDPVVGPTYVVRLSEVSF